MNRAHHARTLAQAAYHRTESRVFAPETHGRRWRVSLAATVLVCCRELRGAPIPDRLMRLVTRSTMQ